MYAYSYRSDGPWLGNHETAQTALDAGRAAYEGNVYVGKMEMAHYSDVFIGARALLSYMQEDAQERHGDDFAEPFESLPSAFVTALGAYVVNAIAEWEADLPDECQFTGQIIKKERKYPPSAMVRPADFK